MFIQNQYCFIYDSNLEDTDKVVHKNLSYGIKQKDGTYVNCTIDGRFVGGAKDDIEDICKAQAKANKKAKTDKAPNVQITGNLYNTYDKKTKKTYTYILVTKVEQTTDF